jgi:hypothetical protein
MRDELDALAGRLNEAALAEDAATLRRLAAAIDEPVFRVVVFGEFNQGKSTLINALLGAPALPMSVLPSTAVLTEIRYAEEPRAVICAGGEEKTLGSIDQLAELAGPDAGGAARQDLEAVALYYPAELCRSEAILYDTPGLNDRAEQDEAATRALDLADLVLFVVDIRRLGTMDERTVLEQWLQGRGLDAVIVAANFVNLVPPEEYSDLRARLAGFTARWGCPYLPESSFEVDALGGLRARLDNDSVGWARSGLGRLAAALERSVTENRQMLQRRSRYGRLRAHLRDQVARLREGAAAAESVARAAAERKESVARGKDRALQQIDGAVERVKQNLARTRSELHRELSEALSRDRESVPDPERVCRERLSLFLSQAREEWTQGLERALRELPPGPKMLVRVRSEWPCALPQPVYRRDPPLSMPHDPEEAMAAARAVTERARAAAGRAAAEVHRGVGSLLDMAANAPDPESRPGRLLRSARGLWSGIHPPEVSEPAPSEPAERIIPASRAEILRVAEGKLGEVGEYSEKMERSLRAAIELRAERETGAAGADAAQARSETFAGALAETERLRARLRAA